MNTKVVEKSSKYDGLKWALVWLLICAGIVANQYYSTQILAVKLAVGLVVLGLVAFIAVQTNKGRQILTFLREAIVELRKVVWPTRQETVQTTIIVVVMVVIVALFLWGIDSVLLWLIGFLTGQRG